MAAESTSDFGTTTVQGLISRMLSRASHCWSDYNRDGDVHPTDLNTFISDSVLTTPPLYADWNYDGTWDGNNVPANTAFYGVDYSKFTTEHN